VGALLGILLVLILGKLVQYLRVLEWVEWVALIGKCFLTFLRVLLSVTLSSLWTVPLGIWIGVSMKRVRVFQPIVQILASFPAPMLFPLIMLALLSIHLSFEVISIVLMMAGVQWYILFNVIAGAIRIPTELDQAARVMGLGFWRRMKSVYLPSIFPSLVTGGLTATGGAWNSSIIAEYVYFRGELFMANGLGATISKTVEHAQFPVLAASLIVMVLVIVLMNRFLWSKLYQLAESRYLLK
jgi:NitT/TauT family transport system permease protein